MPSLFGGSISAVLVNKIIYFCGGITNSATITNCATYNMVSKAFGPMASLPLGVNHAAVATDGSKIYIAGGR